MVLITRNPHHAYLVGDRFVLLKRGTTAGSHPRSGITLDELTRQMAGGSELEELTHELARPTAADAGNLPRQRDPSRQGAAASDDGDRNPPREAAPYTIPPPVRQNRHRRAIDPETTLRAAPAPTHRAPATPAVSR